MVDGQNGLNGIIVLCLAMEEIKHVPGLAIILHLTTMGKIVEITTPKHKLAIKIVALLVKLLIS